MTADPAPTMTAPVSRFLAVADITRSVAFYRDVLGFAVGSLRTVRPEGTEDRLPSEVELIHGPARILIGEQQAAVDSTGERRPRGAAILFLETDDVAAMRAAVIARGGNTTELEKVNWIKYRVFPPLPTTRRSWDSRSTTPRTISA